MNDKIDRLTYAPQMYQITQVLGNMTLMQVALPWAAAPKEISSVLAPTRVNPIVVAALNNHL